MIIPLDVPMHMRNDMCFCTFHCRRLFFREKKPVPAKKPSVYTCLSGLFFN